MHLPSPLPLHDLFSIIHNSIVGGLAVIFNSLLLLAIVRRSPTSLGSYKVLLLNATVVDLLSASTMLLTMARIISARQTLAYVYDGPCIFISGPFCHSVYTLMIGTLSQSQFVIVISFVYRMYILGRPSPTNSVVSVSCLTVSIPNLIVIATYTSMLDDSDDVRAALRVLRPEYQLDEYLVEGHVTIFKTATMFAILALTMPTGPALLTIFVIRRKVLAKLNAHSGKMSERTAQMHKTLSRVLTLQSLLPLFHSGSIVSYGSCQFEIYCTPVHEHLIVESVSYIALCAPAITLYCMKPYRDFVQSIARCDMATLKKASTESSSTRVVRSHSTSH